MLANIVTWLLDPSGLTPHGFCLLWDPGLLYLHAISDIAIGLAYFTIPVALGILARRRRDLVFKPIFWLFATFILLCGTSHWLSVLTLFVPAYGLEGVVKALTAIVSVATAAALFPLLPKALALPSAAQLRSVNSALAVSQARLNASLERSPVPMHVIDADQLLVAVSDTWLKLLGYERRDVIGRSIGDFLSAEATTSTPRADQGADDLVVVERRFIRSDGSLIDAEVSSRFEQEGAKAWTICVVVDVTARRRAEAALRTSEERLHQSQKMEAVGQLTGGIAHDFNNMLQGMSGGLELLERRLAEGKPERVADYLQGIRASLDRASALTQRMLAFARRQTLQPQPTNVNTLVQSLEDLISRTLGPTIALTLRLDEAQWPALCDPNQLESALVNLSINARDAMPDGGTLDIVTTDRRVELSDLSSEDEAVPGDFVEIAVSDNGAGMSPEIMARAFEPFFTTKPIGRGTGLGLSQLYGFVRQSGGLVRLTSQPGRGTTVRLLLPRSAEAASPPMVRPLLLSAPSSQPNDRQRGTVLVVDDETEIRTLMVDVLRDAGLSVLEAGESDAALRHLHGSAPIDLLITDLGLPGMSGAQLARQARVIRPGMPIVLITGYAHRTLEEAGLSQDMQLIQKPFSLDALVGRVLATLDVAGSLDQLA